MTAKQLALLGSLIGLFIVLRQVGALDAALALADVRWTPRVVFDAHEARDDSGKAAVAAELRSFQQVQDNRWSFQCALMSEQKTDLFLACVNAGKQ